MELDGEQIRELLEKAHYVMESEDAAFMDGFELAELVVEILEEEKPNETHD